jgi:uncharacterized protein YecE (DUF72 family)
MNKLYTGTCSWNDHSWVGLVYSRRSRTAADYLPEYAGHFNTAEIDSWFYRIPPRDEAEKYKNAVPKDFPFTVKVPRQLTLVQLGSQGEKGPVRGNPDFLSPMIFREFLEAIQPLVPQIRGIMFEFEYLNKSKMESLDEFMSRLGAFFKALPKGLPYAVETRNGNYLKREYFDFLADKNIMHVFSEKIYMPHVYEVYEKFGETMPGPYIIRLLGNDRREIEEMAAGKWDRILLPKPDTDRVAEMVSEMLRRNIVFLNLNNHYEGSAPLSIRAIEKMIKS